MGQARLLCRLTIGLLVLLVIWHYYPLGRALTLFDLVEPEGAERGCSWSFVPFLGEIRAWSIQNLGPSQPRHYERELFAHATAQQQSVGAQKVSTSVYIDVNIYQTRLYFFVPVRSGRSVLLKKKKGSNICSSSS